MCVCVSKSSTFLLGRERREMRDACRAMPPRGSEVVRRKLLGSKRLNIEILMREGGGNPRAPGSPL